MLPRVNLAMVQFMLGQVDESILQYRETLEIAYRRLPKDKEDDAQAKTGVAVLLIALADAELADERFEDAWLHAKEGHDMLKKIVPDHWQTYRAQSVMGGVHVARKQHEQAVPLLLAAFAKINEAGYRPEMEQRYRLDVAQRLVAAYEGLSQSEEAKKWRRIVDDLK